MADLIFGAIMKIEKINWKIIPDPTFQCFRCQKQIAAYRVQIELFSTTMTICLCDDCSQIPEQDLIEEIRGGKKY